MKLTGKGHRHKTTQAKVKLGEVVEVAKAFQANTFANQLMKTARNTQQEQVKYTTKSPQSSQCFWCGGKHHQQYCPARVQGWNTTTSSTATIQFFSEDTEEETFVTECDKAPRFARKYFANLQLKHGEKTKVVRAQIDSASTCMQYHFQHSS